MPYVEDRGGIDFGGDDPWKGYPVAIVERVRLILSEQLGVRTDQFVPEASFVMDLGIDSLDDVELVMAVEEAFSFAIADEDAERLVTVGDLVQYVKDRTG